MCEQKLAFIGPFWSGNLDLKLRLKSLGLIIHDWLYPGSCDVCQSPFA